METYCPSCGMSVVAVAEGAPGAEIWRCAHCSLVLKDDSPDGSQGLPLGRIALTRVPAADARARKPGAKPPVQEPRRRLVPPVEPAGIEVPEVDPGPLVVQSYAETMVPDESRARGESGLETAISPRLPPVFEQVVVAEDSALLREVIKDALGEAGVSSEVKTCGNGEEFLQTMADGIWRERLPDLAILDVGMPVLNGYYTAIALRSIERGLRVPPTPIVFFTAHACDETFRKVLDYTQPARYLNKGIDAAPARVAERLVQVLASLRH